jgi:lysophospholipase L1-like esterase
MILCATPALAGMNLGKIMPLGDSITDGFNLPPGYRQDLYTLLKNGGNTFTFVGSATDRSTPALDAAGQQHHEGHSGYVIQDIGTSPGDQYQLPFTPAGGIADDIATWLGPNGVDPDYILLMIGTNDVANKYFLDGVVGRLDHLISAISNPCTGLKPSAHLLVASITNTNDAGNRQRFTDFAAAVPGLVASHRALGENVSYVDMYDALDPSTDFVDYEHPGPGGYQKMAGTWYGAIAAAAQAPEPAAIAMVLPACLTLIRRRRSVARASSPCGLA